MGVYSTDLVQIRYIENRCITNFTAKCFIDPIFTNDKYEVLF